jgi:hypothetical protein
MFRMTKAAVRAASVIAVMVVAVLGFGTAAQASPSSYFQLNTLRVDFDHWIMLPPPGVPQDAIVDWQKSGNTVDPFLFGKVTVVNAQGFCGRVRIQMLDSASNILGTYHTASQCPANANPVYDFVGLAPFGATAGVYKVKVSAMLKLNGQSWLEQASATLFAP